VIAYTTGVPDNGDTHAVRPSARGPLLLSSYRTIPGLSSAFHVSQRYHTSGCLMVYANCLLRLRLFGPIDALHDEIGRDAGGDHNGESQCDLW
jgi:hypothetical protein